MLAPQEEVICSSDAKIQLNLFESFAGETHEITVISSVTIFKISV